VVQVTDEARPVLDQAQAIVAELQEEMFAEIDPSDLAVCLRVLSQLTRKLDRV
jgi:DNA-binding MarR family transcriptional regulator